MPKGCIFSHRGPAIIGKASEDSYKALGFTISKVCGYLVNFFNPTISCSAGVLKEIPIVKCDNWDIDTVKKCVSISKQDWDAHETSWDFQRNELLSIDTSTYTENIDYKIEKHFEETGEHISISPAAPKLGSLEWRMEQYKTKWERKFMQLHKNEEELNRQFIDIYGLQDELTPDVPLNEITILQQGEISIE